MLGIFQFCAQPFDRDIPGPGQPFLHFFTTGNIGLAIRWRPNNGINDRMSRALYFLRHRHPHEVFPVTSPREGISEEARVPKVTMDRPMQVKGHFRPSGGLRIPAIQPEPRNPMSLLSAASHAWQWVIPIFNA
jgi:hypothetical protein